MAPPALPTIPRTIDRATGRATISGELALPGIAALYDVAGQIRTQLIALIAAEQARQRADAAPR